MAVDAVLVDRGKLLVVLRRHEPFRGQPALPGGFVELGETVADAVRREVREETGLELDLGRLIGVYSDPDRDPRGHTISIAYEVARRSAAAPRAGSDAADIAWLDIDEMPRLAFDHSTILADYLRRSPP